MTQPPDIERYVERRFAAAERAAVLQLIGAAVIHDAEYARQAGEWVRVRDLNEPLPDDA